MRTRPTSILGRRHKSELTHICRGAACRAPPLLARSACSGARSVLRAREGGGKDLITVEKLERRRECLETGHRARVEQQLQVADALPSKAAKCLCQLLWSPHQRLQLPGSILRLFPGEVDLNRHRSLETGRVTRRLLMRLNRKLERGAQPGWGARMRGHGRRILAPHSRTRRMAFC